MFQMDLKSRILSLKFWVFIIAQIGLIAGYFHVDITKYIGQDWQTLLGLIFGLLGALGVVVDTSTKGISDKVISNTTVQAVNAEQTKEEVKTESTTTAINNTVTENSASSKITVDNPDNIQSIGNEVNATSAVAPQ